MRREELADESGAHPELPRDHGQMVDCDRSQQHEHQAKLRYRLLVPEIPDIRRWGAKPKLHRAVRAGCLASEAQHARGIVGEVCRMRPQRAALRLHAFQGFGGAAFETVVGGAVARADALPGSELCEGELGEKGLFFFSLKKFSLVRVFSSFLFFSFRPQPRPRPHTLSLTVLPTDGAQVPTPKPVLEAQHGRADNSPGSDEQEEPG